MIKNIFKYNLETTDKQIVNLPKGAEILSIKVQRGEPKLWALVDSNEPLEERIIEIFGSGHDIHYDMGVERKFICTYQQLNGSFVGHVFERIN